MLVFCKCADLVNKKFKNLKYAYLRIKGKLGGEVGTVLGAQTDWPVFQQLSFLDKNSYDGSKVFSNRPVSERN